MPTKKRAFETAARRRQIAGYLVSGMSYRDIAAHMNISIGTVSNDVTKMMDSWDDETEQQTKTWRNVEIRRLDLAHHAIWEKVLAGDLGSIDRMVAIQNQRAKFKPGQTNAKEEVPSLSHEERTIRITALLDKARAKAAGYAAQRARGQESDADAVPDARLERARTDD